jgi:hypothetical protein
VSTAEAGETGRLNIHKSVFEIRALWTTSLDM